METVIIIGLLLCTSGIVGLFRVLYQQNKDIKAAQRDLADIYQCLIEWKSRCLIVDEEHEIVIARTKGDQVD